MSQPVAKPIEDRVRLGIVMMLAARLLLSLVDTSVKWLVIAGIPALQLAFMRYFAHFRIATGAMLRTGRDAIRWPAQNAGLVALRAALLVSAAVMNFVALRYLSLMVTSSILFSAPIIVSLLAMLLLGERVGPWRWFAILLAAGAVWTWQNPETLRDWLILGDIGAWGGAGHELFARAHGLAEANALILYFCAFVIYLTATTWLVFGELPDGFTVLGAVIIMSSGRLIWWRENHKALTDAI